MDIILSPSDSLNNLYRFYMAAVVGIVNRCGLTIVWESRSYLHVKIDQILGLKCNNLLSVICIVFKMSSYTYAAIYEEFSKTNRFWLANTEQ